MFRQSILSCSKRSLLSSQLIVSKARPAQLGLISKLSHRHYSTENPTGTEGKPKAKKSKDPSPVWIKIKSGSTFAAASALVLGAAGLAGLVIYLVVSEIFLPSGDTQVFNRAVNLIEKDAKVQELLRLEPGSRLKAYGESGDNKWTRNRPISSNRVLDKSGKEHLFMRFHVESEKRHGSVQLETVQADVLHPEYSYIYLDVKGEKRHYIIAPPAPKIFGSRDKNTGFLGVKWGPKSE